MTGDYTVDSCMPSLLPHHLAMLQASGIAPDVIRAREYRSAITRLELRKLGFNDTQSQCFPALILPTFRPCGEQGIAQIRPDSPRRFASGRIAKYEMPGKERLCLDVPPTVRKDIGDPKVPLFITEGIKKGDALASVGVCVIALLGVTCWRGTNEQGGKTALPDWVDVALNERDVFIVFDSDVMRKKSVYAALRSLREWLQSRGAKVFLIYLPTGDGGAKIGVDDFLASGKSLDDLLRLATDTLLPCPGEENEEDETPYKATQGGLVWYKPSGDGVSAIPLTNFNARIVAQITTDDGAESEVEYRIEASRKERKRTFPVPFAQFSGLQWASEHLGAATVIYPGNSIREHAAAAIRLLSGEPEESRVYTHTGWRKLESGEWVYLHAGGGIGGGMAGVSVRLSGTLERYRLPEPSPAAELKLAVQASLSFLELAKPSLMFPLFAAIFRAALKEADFTLSLSGSSGVFKSELASLAQRHFGEEMDANHLPASWSSTENSLEDLAFRVKDALLVIDDFAPVGGDAQRLHAKADRVIRAQGNNSGRQRMRRDLTLCNPRPPRGLILSTGEDVPQGKSCKARQFILEIEPNDISPQDLSLCQNDAASGKYAAVMAGFLNWLAPQYEEVLQHIAGEVKRLREGVASCEMHRRTPEIVAELMVGLQWFSWFAEDIGVFTQEQGGTFCERAWKALVTASASQVSHQRASDPASRFLELLRSALSSGQAHVASPIGDAPERPERWGWRFRGEGEGHISGEWQPQGRRVGWVDGENLYLEKEEGFNVAKRVSEAGGEGIAISSTTLCKRLKEANVLRSTDSTRQTNYIRKVLEGATQKVLHLPAQTLIGEESDISDISAEEEGFP